MKIYSKNNVLVEAKNRINRLFDDFDEVIVGFSGGKDSTICYELTLEIAKERNRLPLKVVWIDQEAEWQGTVDYCESVFSNPDVEPWWFQMPLSWHNNMSSYSKTIEIWDNEKPNEWIRPKVDISIKDNVYLKFGFQDLFAKILEHHFPDKSTCYVSGVRAEESPRRKLAMTRDLTYKEITWGKILSKKHSHYTFYPIYDWSYTDVWKCIHDNNYQYNRIYDEMYRHGVSIRNMRISNLHHETALESLMLVQEIEPKTWDKIAKRINGANSLKHLERNSFKCPSELPSMFASWEEYAMYLKDNIIQDEDIKNKIEGIVERLSEVYTDTDIKNDFFKKIINTILTHDWDLTKLKNWTEGNRDSYIYREYKKGNVKRYMLAKSKYVTNEMRNELMIKLKEQDEQKTK